VKYGPRPSDHFDPKRPNPYIAPHFKSFVKKEAFFSPQDAHGTIEIEESTEGEFRFRESTLLEQDIPAWCGEVRLRSDHFKFSQSQADSFQTAVRDDGARVRARILYDYHLYSASGSDSTESKTQAIETKRRFPGDGPLAGIVNNISRNFHNAQDSSCFLKGSPVEPSHCLALRSQC
jgi:hypothetical protein